MYEKTAVCTTPWLLLYNVSHASNKSLLCGLKWSGVPLPGAFDSVLGSMQLCRIIPTWPMYQAPVHGACGDTLLAGFTGDCVCDEIELQ
jgi:hypothetical protein